MKRYELEQAIESAAVVFAKAADKHMMIVVGEPDWCVGWSHDFGSAEAHACAEELESLIISINAYLAGEAEQ